MVSGLDLSPLAVCKYGAAYTRQLTRSDQSVEHGWFCAPVNEVWTE